jgi:hypothetical protein
MTIRYRPSTLSKCTFKRSARYLHRRISSGPFFSRPRHKRCSRKNVAGTFPLLSSAFLSRAINNKHEEKWKMRNTFSSRISNREKLFHLRNTRDLLQKVSFASEMHNCDLSPRVEGKHKFMFLRAHRDSFPPNSQAVYTSFRRRKKCHHALHMWLRVV